MKRLVFLLTLAFFAASVAEAAPAQQRTGASAKKTTKTTRAKASNKKANNPMAQKSKAQSRKEARQQTFGLMPSEFNAMGENVFHAKAAAVKGARDTESALRYLPFVSIINTAGFGNQVDLRGQGRLSGRGIQFQINGINANPLDSYYSFMPINTILPSLIREVEVKPGAEFRGGVVNIITSKREAPVFIVGAGYTNAVGFANTYNLFAIANENINANLKINAGAAYNATGGPREGDEEQGTQLVLGAEYALSPGQKLYFDGDYFSGNKITTPLNSFSKDWQLDYLHNIIGSVGLSLTKGNSLTLVMQPELEPQDARTKGLGSIDTTTKRITGALGFDTVIDKYTTLNAKAFYYSSKTTFNTHKSYTPYLKIGDLVVARVKGATSWVPDWSCFLASGHRVCNVDENTNPGNGFVRGDYSNPESNYVTIDQSGSVFEENKMGIKARIDYKHPGGIFIVGYDGVYETSKRNPKGIVTGHIGVEDGTKSEATLKFNDKLDINNFTSTIYAAENFSPTSWFSILIGASYDMMKVNVKKADDLSLVMGGNPFALPKGDTCETGGVCEVKYTPENFTFSVSPVLKFSNTGGLYLKAQTGYKAPPFWAYFNRDLSGVKFSTSAFTTTTTTTTQRIDGLNTIKTYKTDLKDETYWAAEAGFKEYIGARYIPLGVADFDINALLFSASVFYNESKNEFYFTGDSFSGLNLGTYDKTRRMGVEVALEQYFFNGALGFNESFTYLKAEYEGIGANGAKEWIQIPYTFDYKATFGVNVDVTALLDKSTSAIIWLQNSLYGNQKVRATNLSFKRQTPDGGAVGGVEVEHKLKPYIISDLGITVGLNKGAAQLTFGVKNVLDTIYYDYYNTDATTPANENRYLIGRGRAVFLEGQYKY